jgi:predicted PurR-regulated permease PerM
VIEVKKGISTFLLTSICLLVIGVATNHVVKAETVQQGTNQMQNMPDMTPEEHQQMQNMPGVSSNENQQMQNMPWMKSNQMEMEGHQHSHGGIETPPNRFVLGMFALLNAAFILIGIWNKYGRRKVA